MFNIKNKEIRNRKNLQKVDREIGDIFNGQKDEKESPGTS